MRIIDLTYDLEDKMLVWPKNQRPIFEWRERANSDVANVTRMDMIVHTGTHIDSPMHFLPEGEPIDTIPLDRFWGRARLFRFREEPRGQEVSLKAVLDSGFSMGGATMFVLDTGIARLAERRDYNYLFPLPSFELIDWLIGNGVKTYMTDATSLDSPAEVNESPRHKRIFRHGLPVVENLKNLDQVPENRDFTICAMPLKLLGREGSPCRAAAMLED